MSESTIEEVAGRWATIRFDGRRCIHARRCVISQPGVFKANVQGDWIDPDAASAEALMFVALNCPSGAITVERHDGGAPEPLPLVNTITVRENGPLAVHAEIEIDGEPAGTRATLCRCGASNNKPYCDGSHARRWLRRHRRARDQAERTARRARRRLEDHAPSQRAARRQRERGNPVRHGARDRAHAGDRALPLRRLEEQALLRRDAQGDRLRCAGSAVVSMLGD